MEKQYRPRLAAGLALGLCLAAGARAQPPEVSDFAADADYMSPALSPSGALMAFVARVQDQRMLMVLDFAKRERRALLPGIVDSFEISYCSFKNEERLLCGLRGTASERGMSFPISRLIAVDTAGKTKAKVLVQNTDNGASQFQDRVLDLQIADPKRVLIALSGDGDPFPNVHSLDIYTGLSSVVQRSRTPIMQWLTDRTGTVRFGKGFDERRSTYVTRDSPDAPWRTLGKWEVGTQDFDVVGFGPSPATLLVTAGHNGRTAIFEMDLTEKSDRQLVFSHAEVDVGSPIYWPTDRRIVGFYYETDRVNRKFFDSEAEAMYASLGKMLPGGDVEIVDASRDGNKLLLSSRSDVRPTDYYLLSLAEKRLIKVGTANPALAAKAPLAAMKTVQIKSADGQTLQGYLTLPVGSDGKKVKFVVHPHGGPHARDSWGFDPLVQFMASRGYAVLQVNFRGSVGYGREWYQAGVRNWGTVMIDDITAATRWAIAEGIADPAHTCIVGWSYGGYAALMSAARESGLYKCVVSIAGVSDLRALARDDSRFYGGRQWADRNLGTDDDELKAGSPTRSAAKISAPVLLVHGDADYQVDVEHSRRMAKALDREKKKYEIVVIKDGNHSLSRYEWRHTLFSKLEAFLAANN
jgi:dipeptidyl aminopeptidase/acylaminoacyl peptidase